MDLDTIAKLGDQKEKVDRYKAACQQALASSNAELCTQFVDHGERPRILRRLLAEFHLCSTHGLWGWS